MQAGEHRKADHHAVQGVIVELAEVLQMSPSKAAEFSAWTLGEWLATNLPREARRVVRSLTALPAVSFLAYGMLLLWVAQDHGLLMLHDMSL